MITVLTDGYYTLYETKNDIKILILDDMKMFAWVYAEHIGEILVVTKRAHKAEHILAKGKYRLYDVHDEPNFIDLIHLELFVGEGTWQGYLLPNGLPTLTSAKHRIIPTDEVVTKTLSFHPTPTHFPNP